MRVDRVGVRDLGEVPCGARGTRHSSSGDDSRRAWRQWHAGMVIGRIGAELDAPGQPCWLGIGVGDGARVQHGARELHRPCSGGAHGMREYGVGVGDLNEVPGRHGISGHSSSGDDGRGKGRECNAGILSGCIRAERDASPESSRHGIELSDGARVEHGACDLHRESSGGPHGMRVNRVGVGDLSEVSGGTWSSGDPASRDDGG
jgi:hypothetical protein